MALASLLVACSRSPRAEETALQMAPTATTMVSEPSFRIVAYATTGIVPEIIPYGRLTHLNYAFLIPNADGSFQPLTNRWKLEKIVADAHEAGVQVLIAVGGWGWDEQFETMAADPARRALFVRHLTALVDEYGLDGADIDWEYPDAGDSSQNFLALIRELRQAMPDKLLTAAVVGYGDHGDGVPDEAFASLDFLNVMTYDGPDHGTREQFDAGLAYWLARGVPREKLVMGLPFYARPGQMTYRKIVAADPEAAYGDEVDYYGTTLRYNGIRTVQEKTRLAQTQAGGIMFWTLDHDATGDLSLLKAIAEVVIQE